MKIKINIWKELDSIYWIGIGGIVCFMTVIPLRLSTGIDAYGNPIPLSTYISMIVMFIALCIFTVTAYLGHKFQRR